MVGSPSNVAESSIGLLDRGFGFGRRRLRGFERRRRRASVWRRMKVIEFLKFLSLGIHKFTLRLIFHQVDFDFQFRLGLEILHMLVFYANRFKGLNKSKVTLFVTEVSSKG